MSCVYDLYINTYLLCPAVLFNSYTFSSGQIHQDSAGEE